MSLRVHRHGQRYHVIRSIKLIHFKVIFSSIKFAYLVIFITTVAIGLQAGGLRFREDRVPMALSAAALITQQKNKQNDKGQDPRPKWRIRFFYRIANTTVNTFLHIGREDIVANLATLCGYFRRCHRVNLFRIPPRIAAEGCSRRNAIESPENIRKTEPKHPGCLDDIF